MNKDELKLLCISENRICPMPPQWVKFEELLAKISNEKPPHSLILASWFESSDKKIARIQEQIDWADERGLLNVAIEYLNGLTESQWYKGFIRRS